MALIKCPECDSEISDQANFCPKCGFPLKKTEIPQLNAEAKAPDISDGKKPKSGKRLFWLLAILGSLIIIIILIVILSHKRREISPQNQTYETQNYSHGYWQKQTIPLLNGSILVKAGERRYFEFSTDAKWTNMNISGNFRASGGTGNDIRVLVLTKIDFENLVNGHTYNYFYDSGQITVSRININLPSTIENYVLVFTNVFSTFSAKEVNGKIDFSYSYWQAE